MTPLSAALDWVGDWGRILWGFAYWNARKSAFRLRGASGHAPCQHPSDSGRAGATGCEACRDFRRPERFRRVCPLLAPSTGTRRLCSVDAASVRPFWGRAALFYGCLGALVAAAGVLGTYSVLRWVGYRVPLYAVAWPPAWHRIRHARADYFYRMALGALGAGDVRRAYLALGQVNALDPSNDKAALLLAQFTQLSNPEYSDSLYTRLVRGPMPGAEDAAQAWFRALLERGAFPALARLSEAMLRRGAGHSPSWAQGLLFSEAMTGDPAPTDALNADPGSTPADIRATTALAAALRAAPAAERAARLRAALAAQQPGFLTYYCASRMVAIGEAGDALSFLDGRGAQEIGAYDAEALKLDAYSTLGWRVLEQSEIAALLSRGPTVANVTLIAAHLIRHPDAATAAAAFELIAAAPLAPTAENSGAHIALLCMAGVNGLTDSMRAEAGVLAGIPGGNFAASSRLREFFEGPPASQNPSVILPALPQLPIEVVYAMLGRYRQRSWP